MFRLIVVVSSSDGGLVIISSSIRKSNSKSIVFFYIEIFCEGILVYNIRYFDFLVFGIWLK